MPKTIEQEMQNKLQKLQDIEAHKVYLENLITRYEKQITRLMAKLPDGYMTHTILSKNMISIKEKMRTSKSNYYDGVVEYWKANDSRSSYEAKKKILSEKYNSQILAKRKKAVWNLYDENFERNSVIDAIVFNRESMISVLKFQIKVLNMKSASLRKSLTYYIGNEVLDGVYLNPDVTPQPAYVPAKKQVLKKNKKNR